ncbi:MAG: hypothetical protein WC499_02670 [Patescibacteria group bacterium]
MEENQELAVVKTQVTKALSAVNELVIKTPEDYTKADEIRSKIKAVGKMIDTKKKEITKPLNDSLKKIRELFAPIETTYESVEKIINNKMVVYRDEQDKIAEAKKLKIASQVESGHIKATTAIKKMESIVDTKTTLKEAGVKSTTRKLPRVRILNEKLIPREYLVVNEKFVLEALKAGKAVDGAELYYETIIA